MELLTKSSPPIMFQPQVHHGYKNSYSNYYYQTAPFMAPAAVPPVGPPASNGGISAHLDYDMDQMTKFVCWICFGLMKIPDPPSTSFIEVVKSVLVATRLPKSTLILSLFYLSNKLEKEKMESNDQIAVFHTLTASLVLANKFNDDNTFTNRSWSEATGIAIETISQLEREWLSVLGWNLHLTSESGYKCLEECWNTWCAKFVPPCSPQKESWRGHRKTRSSILPLINQPAPQSAYSYYPQQQNYSYQPAPYYMGYSNGYGNYYNPYPAYGNNQPRQAAYTQTYDTATAC